MSRPDDHPLRARLSQAPAYAWVVTALVSVLCVVAIITAAQAPGNPSAAGWNGFGAGNWPAANWRPYGKSSPFNQPIGNAAAVPRSAELVANSLQWGPPPTIGTGQGGSSYDYGHPIYYAQPTDPSYVLHPTESWGHNSMAGRRIRVPSAARPAGGSDGHMTVITPDGWEYDMWRAQPRPPGGGTLTFAWGGRVRIDQSGLDSGATAAHFASLAGVMRPEELAAGHIDHALFIVLKCAGTGAGFGYGVHQSRSHTSGYVYPAGAGGSSCDHRTSNLPPLGARFQLAMSAGQIAALHAPAWKVAILTALARYGGYVGDTGGAGFALMMQSAATYTSFGAPDPLIAVARRAGLTPKAGRYLLDLAAGVDWQRYLRIVTPPAAPRGPHGH